jgi:hypothetical protein
MQTLPQKSRVAARPPPGADALDFSHSYPAFCHPKVRGKKWVLDLKTSGQRLDLDGSAALAH